MEREEYKKTADSFSNIIKRFFITIAEVLEKEGLTVMVAGHILYLHPECKDVRASTFALGSEEILRGIPRVLEEEIEAYFKEFKAEEIKKDIISGFERILTTKNKKPRIH